MYLLQSQPPNYVREWTSVCDAHTQLSNVYLMSAFDVTHMIKCTLSLSLAGRAWEQATWGGKIKVKPRLLYRQTIKLRWDM